MWSGCGHKSNPPFKKSAYAPDMVKILLGITLQGTVSYVSEAWGGRISDKYLTESCGILNYLLPGDIVLADCGFDISDSVGMMQARLHIPAFIRGKSQLDALGVENTPYSYSVHSILPDCPGR